MVKVRFESTPPGASVLLDDVELGRTPLDAELAGSDERTSFVFRLADYADSTVVAALDRDIALSAVLTAKPAARSGRNGKAAAMPASAGKAAPAAAVSAPPPAATPEPVAAPAPAPRPDASKGFEKVGSQPPPSAPGKVGDLKKF
jgi:hypothetical protein